MQNIKKLSTSVLPAVALVALAGCGGGGGGGLVQDASAVLDGDATGSSDVSVLTLNAATESVGRETGTLDRDAGTVTFGSVDGTLEEDLSGADVEGGAITFEGDTDTAAVRFDAAIGTTTTTGIIGVSTDPAGLPSGTASYTGDTVITAIAGTDVFELTGSAAIDADFANDMVTTTLSSLTGTRQPALAAPEAIADAGTLTLEGAAISGAGFSGGTATLDSTVLSLSGDETVALEGSFYGADADEVGGVFVIDDDETRIFGDFLAD